MGKLRYLFSVVLFLAVFTSCQKDETINEVTQSSLKADSAKMLSSLATATGNSLATSGTLKITIQDSTYTFDASKDSIAFVNLYMDNKKYFGITAINKAHTISFGISSLGDAATNTIGTVAGSQFLFNNTNKTITQYTLSQHPDLQDPGKINIGQFSRDSVLAKGTFVTYLTKDAKPNSTFYKAEGSFDLKKK